MSEADHPADPSPEPPGRWTRALGGDAAAMRELAASSWYGVYAWWRRGGLEAARAAEATAKAFAHWITAAPPSVADAGAARLREWLPARLATLAGGAWENADPTTIALDPAWAERRYAEEPPGEPGAIFQRRWALTLLEGALADLRGEYDARAAGALFAELLPFAGYAASGEESYVEAASRTGLSSSAMRKAVFDFRARQRTLLRRHLADTVADPADIDSELTALLLACDAAGPSDAPLPSTLAAVQPDQVLARAMHSAKMSSAGGLGWEPPTVAELARLFPAYETQTMLGHGGMGAVYRACQTSLDRPVAIKILPLEISVDQDFADRFRREARAMAKLNHPHIISVFDFGQTAEGHLYFVMEFVEGANLHDLIHGGRRGVPGPSLLPPGDALALIEQVCDALAYAHGKGIVHRDIKPANVMVDREGQVKVADFGLARITDAASAEQWGTTMTGIVMGTPDYMSPEQKRGSHVDHRADIYALGVMLYEALCKETPQGAFELPSKRCGLDKRLDAIITKALAQQADARFQSTAEMKTAIALVRPAVTKAHAKKSPPKPAPASAPKPATAPRPPSSAPAAKKPVARWIGMAVGVLALATVLAFVISAKKPAPSEAATTLDASQTLVARPVEGRPLDNPGAPAPAAPPGTHMPGTSNAVAGFPATAWKDWLAESRARGSWSAPNWRDDGTRVESLNDTTLMNPLNARDQAVRVTWQQLPPNVAFSIFLRGAPAGPQSRGTGYQFFIEASGEVRLLHWEGGDARATKLASWPAPSGFKPSPGQTYEFRAVGETLSALRDGVEIGRARDNRGKQGNLLFSFARGAIFTALEYAKLDAPAAATPAPVAAADPVKKRDFGGHRYALVEARGIAWAEAKARAEALGGHLAVVTSREEHAFLEELFGPPTPAQAQAWLGGLCTRPGRDGWTWITGEPFAFQMWAGDNPNSNQPGDALTFIRNPGVQGWNDFENPTAANSGLDRSVRGFLVEWESAPPVSPAAATKDAPFVNGLGMKFVPVPITGGPTGGKRVLFSIWETRAQDYAVFLKETQHQWPKRGSDLRPTLPVESVTWEEAQAFCRWLTEWERRAGKLGATESYRLPSDHEWSCAAGIGDREDPAQLPSEKSARLPELFPWGSAWPPSAGAGNYSGEESVPNGDNKEGRKWVAGYRDAFIGAAPVGSFAPDRFGLFDLSGNAWEWCEDWFDATQRTRVLRGGAAGTFDRENLRSASRTYLTPTARNNWPGFRVVLAPVVP